MLKVELESLLKPFGQDHLLAFWETLTQSEQNTFYDELKGIDYKYMMKLYNEANEEMKKEVKKDDFMECLTKDCVGKKSSASVQQQTLWWDSGLKEISEGHVAVLLLAGGQGSRLGVNYPKGMYNVGLPSGKTLYQLQAERILKLEKMALDKYQKHAHIRWYIMTSDATLAASKAFFEENSYFGLKKENVVFFEQNQLPCLTFSGKMMLSTKASISKAPDGNGGLYGALVHRNILADLEKHGVKHLQVYCVDNILVKVADPSFIGFSVEKRLECCNKVIVKVDPKESVGVVCKLHGKYQIVEYSEISPAVAERRDQDGSLLFKDSNICLHYFSLEFLKRLCRDHLMELPHHIAKKKIPHVDLSSGEVIQPSTPNGMKLEKFVFDVFQFSTKFAVFEVERDEEFSPLKNASDSLKCTPDTCRRDLAALHAKFLANAGVKIDNDALCEISPLVSYGGEGLSEFQGNSVENGDVILINDDSHWSVVSKKQ